MCQAGEQKNKSDKFGLFVLSSDVGRDSSVHHLDISLCNATAMGFGMDLLCQGARLANE